MLNIDTPISCIKCLYKDSHPFGISFDKQVCTGCITHEEKDSIEWNKKENELKDLLKNKLKSKRGYDCVVPVIGDAEDFYTLHRVTNLGLSPLVVSVNDYFKNDIGWHNLHQLITYFDVDSLVFNPDIRVYKDLVRTSLRKYSHILLPFLQLHTSFPVHIALERKIPLVIWGQNQSIEQVGKFSHYDKVEMSKWSRKQHDLFGINNGVLIGNGAQVDERYLNYYKYPKIERLNQKRVTGIYLSNYFRWDPLHQNNQALKFGFKAEKNLYSFDPYERAGSSVYYKFHDLLKFKRLGYRKITDHLVREIRHKRIKKEDAIEMESNYTQKTVNIKPFFDWLGSTKSGLDWFKKHRLEGLRHLISEEEPDDDEVKIPLKINNLIGKTDPSNEEFLIFDKGISI